MADTIAGITILVKDRRTANKAINEVLSNYGEIIAGRMGIPHLSGDTSVISLIVQGEGVLVDSLMCDLTNVEATKGFRTVLAKFES